ncbi:hypothetical protein BDR22DRAFT_964841 [Usnea florida]
MVSLTLSLALAFSIHVLGDKATGVFIPSVDTYLLPSPFRGYEAVDTNSSTNFVNTVTANTSINTLFSAAKNATYYAFDEEFYTILGSKTPDIQLIATKPSLFAYEAGAWDYDLNQVWFTSSVLTPPTTVSILDLATNKIQTLDIPALRNINPNGGYYFNKTIYLTTAGNLSLPNGAPAIYAINTTTHAAVPILNNFYGLKFQSIDDLSWVHPSNTTSCTTTGPTLFFSSLNLRTFGINATAPQKQQDGVYRYSPTAQSVQGVISRADIISPNGVRSDATGRYLYVTGTAAPFSPTPTQPNPFLSNIIYRYTLDEDCFPMNKRLLATVRSYADGLHVDSYGRVWTGEWDGITVRRGRDGKVLGVFNAEALVVGEGLPPMANFALAGDKLVVLALDRVYVVQLGQNVTSRAAGTQ